TSEVAKCWTLDGKRVVGELSSLAPSGKRPASGDIAVWDVATGAQTKLTSGDGGVDGHADWTPPARPWVFPRVAGNAAAAGADSASRPPQPGDTAAWSRHGGGVANIEYDLPKAGHVRVLVYDAAGHEVARPVDEWQPAGRHQTMFAFGLGPNQVFHYRVECGGRH